MGRRLLGKKKWIALVGAVVVAAAAVGGWALARPDESAATTTITAKATVGTIRQTVAATGTLARGTARRPDVPGCRHCHHGPGRRGRQGRQGRHRRHHRRHRPAGSGRRGAGERQRSRGPGRRCQRQHLRPGRLCGGPARPQPEQPRQGQGLARRRDAELPHRAAPLLRSASRRVDAVGSAPEALGLRRSTSGGTSNGTSNGTSTAQVVVIATNAWVVNASVGASDLASVKKGLQIDITPDGSAQRVFGTVSSVGIMASTGSSEPRPSPSSSRSPAPPPASMPVAP